MTLTPGARLGPYEVTDTLGAGGMGEVYRARDTKLGRDVALKIISDAFALDADRVARFKREAQVLASLNDPHIAAIYGFEDSGAMHALVLELVEGETLAELIASRAGSAKGGPAGLPVDEALPIARQIAEALEAAHEQGIIHRDLKPANIKITPDGVVKVLDFGLAKLAGPAEAGHYVPGGGDRSVRLQPDLAMSPTITSPAMMTGVGMLLGTAAYMSPEQAKGRPADKRSDVWSFGCVLYEMLTGRRAFDGEDMVDVLGAVARLEPNWDALPLDVPPAIRALLQGCLTKDRRHRVADMSTALFVIDKAAGLAPPGATAAVPPLRRQPLWRRALPVAAALLVGSLVTALSAIYVRETPPEPPETRLEIATPPGRLSFFKLSPDGRKIVFSAAASEGKPSQLWLRPLESEAAHPLAGTENAEYPFWSPDSRSIGFVAGGQLMRLDLAVGGLRALADAPRAFLQAAWGPDGTVLFTPTATSALYRVPAGGGLPAEVTHLSRPAEASHRSPEFLPDGRHFLFYVAGTAAVQGIYIGSLDTTDTRRVLESESAAVFAPPNYVLFSRQDNLLAQRLDLKTLAVTGEPISLAAQVSGDQGTVGEIAVSSSQTGWIAYRAPISESHQLTWFDRTGRPTGTLNDVDTSPVSRTLRISPDGRTVAEGREINGNVDLWFVETARGVLRRFTSDPSIDNNAVWAPDGSRVAFVSRRSGPQNVWVKRVDGGTDERLRESAQNEVPTDWSRDGRFILFTTGLNDVWALPVEGAAEPIAVARTNFNEDQARFSPDGRSVAYQSNETGRNEIYVVPFPGPGVPLQISTNGGGMPQWRDDGREILYLGQDRKLMAVAVVRKPDGRLEVGIPTSLFTIAQGASYDITRDAQRILIDTPIGQATTPPITIIQNWKPRS